MVLKQSPFVLKALAVVLLASIIISCNDAKTRWRYDNTIIETKTDTLTDCNIYVEPMLFKANMDSLGFKREKSKIFGLCDENSKIEKFMKTKQVYAELFYNGSANVNQSLISLFSLKGHSGKSAGLDEGYMLITHKNHAQLVKVYSSAPEDAHMTSFYKNGYLLIVNSINEGYDLADSNETIDNYFVVLNVAQRKIHCLNQKESLYHLKTTFNTHFD